MPFCSQEMLAGKYGKDCLEESSADADLFTLMVGVKEVKFNMKTRVSAPRADRTRLEICCDSCTVELVTNYAD